MTQEQLWALPFHRLSLCSQDQGLLTTQHLALYKIGFVCLLVYLFASLGCHIGDTACKAVSKLFSTHPCATILSNPSVCVAKTGVPSRQRRFVSHFLGLAVLCMEDLLSGLRPDSCESLT